MGEGLDPPLPGTYSDELARFCEELGELRIVCNKPAFRAISRAAENGARNLSTAALSEVFSGQRLPGIDFLIALIRTLHTMSDGRTVAHDDPRLEHWRARWRDMERLRLRERRHGAAGPAQLPDVELPGSPDTAPLAAEDAREQADALLTAARNQADGIKTVAAEQASHVLEEAQTERNQAAADRAHLRSTIAEELATARREAQELLDLAVAQAAQIREEAELQAATRLSSDVPDETETPPEGKRPRRRRPEPETWPRPRRQRGQDATIRLPIDLEEAAFGTHKDIEVDTAALCTTCNGELVAPGTTVLACEACAGHGKVPGPFATASGACPECQGFGTVLPFPCPGCLGGGRVRVRRTLTVKIPAGVDNGTRVQLAGEGEVGPGGGPASDLFIAIDENPHATFQRRGDDLHCTVTLPMTAAAIGTKVPLETLDGTVEVDVRPGTQSGQSIPLHGRGVTHLRGGGRGDLIVHAEVQTPVDIDAEQEELLRRLASLRAEDRPAGTYLPGQQGIFSRLRDSFNGR